MPLTISYTIEGKYRTLNLRRHSLGCAVMFHDPDGVPCLLSSSDLRDLAQACEHLASTLEAEALVTNSGEADPMRGCIPHVGYCSGDFDTCLQGQPLPGFNAP